MGDERTSANASEASGGYFSGISSAAFKRLKQVLWAGAISLVFLFTMLLDPIDQMVWLIQSRIASHQPSGDIVFVATDPKIEDPAFGHLRSELAGALNELDQRGVGKVYLNLAFDRSSNAIDDRMLAMAIQKLGPRLVLVNRKAKDARGKPILVGSVPEIAGKSGVVASFTEPNYLGFVWEMPYAIEVGGKRYATFASALGGQTQPIAGNFQVNYGIFANDIPALELDDLFSSNPATLTEVAGKTIVIGTNRSDGEAVVTIPGHKKLPDTYIAIYAAETLKASRTMIISGLFMLAAALCILVSTVLLASTRRQRHAGYSLLIVGLPLLIFVTARLGIRIEVAYGLGSIVFYAMFRIWARWKERVAMIEQDTGLPTLRALDDIIAGSSSIAGHIVAAKIQGYEHVLKTLSAQDRTVYIRKLADRLRAADKDLTVYFDGHYLGWHAPTDDTQSLIEHLEGLRAIFAQPVQAGAHIVDVGITFGIARFNGTGTSPIPAAIAAVEETDEASTPIKVAENGSHSDLLWDLSLRARIDEAMEAGEIYCVYQPKVDIRTGDMTGVEALVRWHDPNRGFISPMHFIRQCEKAGRMEHLTRYVLQSACTAGQLLHFRGHQISMSVNISATLLGDMRIVGVVRNVLQATSFNPRYLTLEVTETARISNLSTAASILNELKALGAHISIDDFGVGAANFETFFELPFDELKIDRLFIANMVTNPKARAIASSIVAMGKEARITIVAEGVENPEDLEILNEIGCSQVQGYAISRPVSLTNLLEFKESLKNTQSRNMV